jgi:hypothetical protein
MACIIIILTMSKSTKRVTDNKRRRVGYQKRNKKQKVNIFTSAIVDVPSRVVSRTK